MPITEQAPPPFHDSRFSGDETMVEHGITHEPWADTHITYDQDPAIAIPRANAQAVHDLDAYRDRLTVLHAENPSADLASYEGILAEKTLQHFDADGYNEHPHELVNTLAYFADKPEFTEGFVHDLLKRYPALGDWIIDKFAAGDPSPLFKNVATGRAFIWETQAVTAEARQKPPHENLSFDEQQQLIHAARLKQAILARSGFNANEQLDITEAWSAEWDSRNKKDGRADMSRTEIAENALANEWENLMALASQYRTDPTAPPRLFKEFGIRNFGRYYDLRSGKSALTGQLSPESNAGEVVLSAVDDWSGGLRNPGPVKTAGALGIHDPVFVEARTPREAVRRIIQSRNQSDSSSIQRLLVLAHGNRGHIGDLSIGDLRKFRGLEKLRGRVLSDDAEIILDSCDTGKQLGIARKLARLTGIKVVAPPAKSTGLHRSEDGTYTYAKNKQHHQLPARVYQPRRTPRHAVRNS